MQKRFDGVDDSRLSTDSRQAAWRANNGSFAVGDLAIQIGSDLQEYKHRAQCINDQWLHPRGLIVPGRLIVMLEIKYQQKILAEMSN
jgi:hypothetical protein